MENPNNVSIRRILQGPLSVFMNFNRGISGIFAFCFSGGALASIIWEGILFFCKLYYPTNVPLLPTSTKIGGLVFILLMFPAWLVFSSDNFTRKKLAWITKELEGKRISLELAEHMRWHLGAVYVGASSLRDDSPDDENQNQGEMPPN